MAAPATATLSPDALDYLQRTGVPAAVPDDGQATSAPPELRRLIRVSGRTRASPSPDRDDGRAVAPPSEPLLVGLSDYRIPLAFVVSGRPDDLALHVGTWSPAGREEASADTLDARLQIVETLLRSAYGDVEVGPPDIELPTGEAGLAVGVPTAVTAAEDDASALDRLVQALTGTSWSLLVLAEPVDESVTAELRDQALNEARAVTAATQASGAPSPLADRYLEVLQATLDGFSTAQVTGGWRTAVYLLGDEGSYHRLASTWRGLFSGRRSLPDPVRVHTDGRVARLAADWELPDGPAPSGPGHYRHPFACQTLLTSGALGAYVHLPRRETPGFQVRAPRRFDSIPPVSDGPSWPLGEVVDGRRPAGVDYRVPRETLQRHALVAGTTGSGKTNTVVGLLRTAADDDVPFLVLEPAKREYRDLLLTPEVGDRLRVFTPGDERISPVRLNPLEVPEGTDVAVHLDLLRAVFGASFGLWTPLPQVLERCLHEVYADRGWDTAGGGNVRLDADGHHPAAFPTLTDLAAKIPEVVGRLGYDREVADNVRAALGTRLEALRTGGKGQMLDVSTSMPLDELFDHPAVVELEGIGDDGDKAFVMALLLIRLTEHRRRLGRASGLRHLLVVEEAHRLLAATADDRPSEQADPRGQAVATFSHLIAEVRSYGQAVVVADQSPVRLAPDVVKNTNLKVAHRTIAADDQAALAGAMNMDDTRARALTSLAPGEAAVFGAGDDAPVLVQVRLVTSSDEPPPDHDRVADHMRRRREEAGISLVASPLCTSACAEDPAACASARRLVGDREIQRTITRAVLSMIDDPDGLDRVWVDVVAAVRARRPPQLEEEALLQSFAGHAASWYAGRRGAQSGWSYEGTDELAFGLRDVLADVAAGGSARTAELRSGVGEVIRRLHRRHVDPFPACSTICDQDTPMCLYRHGAADLLPDRHLARAWEAADAADAQDPGGGRSQSWEAAMDAGYAVIEFPEQGLDGERRETVALAARRASLCYGQQRLAGDTRKPPPARRRLVDELIRQSGHRSSAEEAS